MVLRTTRRRCWRGVLFTSADDEHVDLAVVALVLLLLNTELVPSSLCYSVQDSRVCRFNANTPVEGVDCTALDWQSSSCNISRLINNYCYLNRNFDKCKYNVEYNISSSGSELTLWNLNETTLPIIVTTNQNDIQTNWVLETQNTSRVIVTGLPDNSTIEVAYIFNNLTCPGCPAPTFNWYPHPNKHRIRFKLDLEEESIQVLGNNVTVRLYSSNDSRTTEDHICLMGWKPNPRIVSGLVNTLLTIDDIYGTEFCISFELTDPVDKNVGRYNYACGRHLDMLDHHTTPIQGEIRTPLWWSVTLGSLSAILSGVLLTLFAARKGWLRAPFSVLAESRRAIETNSEPNANAPTVVTADITNDTTTVAMKPTNATVTSTPITKALRAFRTSGEKRLSDADAASEQSEPFLNGAAPTSSTSMTKTQRR